MLVLWLSFFVYVVFFVIKKATFIKFIVINRWYFVYLIVIEIKNPEQNAKKGVMFGLLNFQMEKEK